MIERTSVQNEEVHGIVNKADSPFNEHFAVIVFGGSEGFVLLAQKLA